MKILLVGGLIMMNTTTFLPVEIVLIVGWVLASIIGTWAYFANQPKE